MSVRAAVARSILCWHLFVFFGAFGARRDLESDLDAGACEPRGHCAYDRRCRLPILVEEDREGETWSRAGIRLSTWIGTGSLWPH